MIIFGEREVKRLKMLEISSESVLLAMLAQAYTIRWHHDRNVSCRESGSRAFDKTFDVKHFKQSCNHMAPKVHI